MEKPSRSTGAMFYSRTVARSKKPGGTTVVRIEIPRLRNDYIFMPNGSKGDSPLSDMLIHGSHPFPADIEAMLREVLSIDPKFPDGLRHYVEQVEWMRRFNAWARGKGLEEGRNALRNMLEQLRPRGGPP